MRILRNQRGETIVEVLIAIAVIASILGTSYAIVNRNSSSYQQANERTQAVKLAEQQLELVRNLTSTERKAVKVSDTFCIKVTTIEYDESNCMYESNRYKVVATRTLDTFSVTTSWDGIRGNSENVSIGYRIPE